MFLYYARVLALGLLTLSISCPLYTMEKPAEETNQLSDKDIQALKGYLRFFFKGDEVRKRAAREGKPVEDAAVILARRKKIAATAPLTIKNIVAKVQEIDPEFRERVAADLEITPDQLDQLKELFPVAAEELPTGKDRILIVAKDANNKPSVLLISRDKNTWSALEPVREVFEMIKQHYPGIDFSKAVKEKITQGKLQGATLFITPINFVEANAFKAKGAELTWIPLDDFVTLVTSISKPLAQKGPQGQENLATVDYQLQKVIKSLAEKIKGALEQPISEVKKSGTETTEKKTTPTEKTEKIGTPEVTARAATSATPVRGEGRFPANKGQEEKKPSGVFALPEED
jgi:hypothetical protein